MISISGDGHRSSGWRGKIGFSVHARILCQCVTALMNGDDDVAVGMCDGRGENVMEADHGFARVMDGDALGAGYRFACRNG